MKKIRLDAFISSQTDHSRRDIEQFIKEKKITVNGRLETSFSAVVNPSTDSVCLNGEQISLITSHIYYKYHKPRGEITTMEDPKNRRHVGVVFKGIHRTLFPVGRLDRQTSGLLIATNDGAFSHRLTHPSYSCKKMYRVTLDSPIKKEDARRLLAGFFLEDGPVQFVSLSVVSEFGVDVSLQEGRNRIVRRSFEFFGYEVKKLHRISIGSVGLGKLKPGEYSALTPKELKALKG